MKDEPNIGETQRDLVDAVSELRQAHPSLPERLGRYRDKRAAYEAKRMSVAQTAVAPGARGVQRELHG